MSRKNKVKIFKIILTVLVIVLFIGIIAYLFPVMKNLSTVEGQIAFKQKVENSGFLGLLTLFALQVAQIFLIVVPGEPIEILAGMCYGGIGGTIFIMVSAFIISTTIFLLVRKIGRKFVYDFCDSEKVAKIENSKIFQNPKKIEMIMLILFLIPGTPKDLMVYIAGLLPIKPIKFILISTICNIFYFSRRKFCSGRLENEYNNICSSISNSRNYNIFLSINLIKIKLQMKF